VIAAEEVPAGRYTLAMLDIAARNEAFGPSFRDGVVDNIVSYEENVRAVLSKVSLGEADVGVVYSSDLIGSSADKIGSLSIPDDLNMTATYPIAPISNLKQTAIAQSFIDFVLSDTGQETLRNYGFIPIGDRE
jgi:molybdate transport system substrate-binding protein